MQSNLKNGFRLFAALVALSATSGADAGRSPAGNFPLPRFSSCDPSSEFVTDFSVSPVNREETYSLDLGFCSQWNPEFRNNGFRCCAHYIVTRRKKLNRCAPERRGGVFCHEMTEEQKLYTELVKSGALDPLAVLDSEMGASGQQALCGVNNGFLANGRRVVPTDKNRIQMRTPGRCVDFGTDGMIGMLEWTGRQIAKEYSSPEHQGVHLIVGDVAAPRGGCLSGRGGRRGHASHTNGKDADIGFLTVRSGRSSPVDFHRDFDAKTNWWLLKQIFKNPYACVKVVFLDKKHIRKLEKAARGDEEWKTLWRFIRHMPAHKNHLHVRVGDFPGQPGCTPNARPELEEGDEVPEGVEGGDLDLESSDAASDANGQDASAKGSSSGSSIGAEDDSDSAAATPAPVDPSRDSPGKPASM